MYITNISLKDVLQQSSITSPSQMTFLLQHLRTAAHLKPSTYTSQLLQKYPNTSQYFSDTHDIQNLSHKGTQHFPIPQHSLRTWATKVPSTFSFFSNTHNIQTQRNLRSAVLLSLFQRSSTASRYPRPFHTNSPTAYSQHACNTFSTS